MQSTSARGPSRLALCVSGQARDLSTYVALWHQHVQQYVVKADTADFFLVLSDVASTSDRSTFANIRHELRPVLAVTSQASDCTSPLLKPLCRNLTLAQHDQRRHPRTRARVQFFWITHCFNAVVAYEQLSAISYDFVVRLRPDLVVLAPLPPLASLPLDAVIYATKAAQPWDALYLIPRHLLLRFAEALSRALEPASIMEAQRTDKLTNATFLWHECCPEGWVVHYATRHGGVPMRALEPPVPMALQRRCVLECLYFPRHDANGSWLPEYPFVQGGPIPNALTPSPTEWERSCYRAAWHLGVFPATHRSTRLLGLERTDILKLSQRSSSPQACAFELNVRLCRHTEARIRRQVGWDYCDRSPGWASPSALNASVLPRLDRNHDHRNSWGVQRPSSHVPTESPRTSIRIPPPPPGPTSYSKPSGSRSVARAPGTVIIRRTAPHSIRVERV